MPLTEKHDRHGDDRGHAPDSADARLDELESLYRATPVGIAVVDLDLRYVRANEQYAQLTGRPVEEIVGRTMHEVVHPSVRTSAIELAQGVIDTGRPEWNIEIPGISRDDPPEPITWQTNVYPIHTEGRVQGAVAVLQDVTRLKALERSRNERLEELELIYRNAPIGLAFFDAQGRIARVNRWLVDKWKVEAQELVGKRLDQIESLHPTAEEREVWSVVGAFGRVENRELRVCPPSDPGVEHVYIVNAEPMKLTGATQAGILVTVHDVTEQVRAEQEADAARTHAEEQLRELQSVYDHSPVGLLMVDTEMRIVRVNRLVAAALNRSDGAVTGIKLDTLLPTEMSDQVIPLCERVIRTGQPQLNVEVRGSIAGRPGREYVWLMNQHPVMGKNGEVQAVIAVAQNITPLRRQQEELEEIRQRLEEAQRMARVGSWEWNIVEDVMWWSEELFSITGTTPGTFKPSWENFFELAVAEDRPKVRAQLDATLQRNEPYWVEFRIVLPSLEERVLRCAAKLDRTSKGIPARLFGTCQDITAAGSAPRV